jgi:hypothetical protein
MFGRKALPFGTIVLVSIIALAVMGLGYATWSNIITDAGTVTTGTFGAVWTNTFTDDGANQESNDRDLGDIHCADAGTDCIYPVLPAGVSCDGSWTDPACSARDPKGPGPNAPRTDKAIGHCWSGIDSGDAYKVLHWGVDNAYPGYYCTVWSYIGSSGTVPMKIQSRTLNVGVDSDISTGFVNDGIKCGAQIDPGDQLEIGMWIRVDEASQYTVYAGDSSYTLVQWNEFNQNLCNFP